MKTLLLLFVAIVAFQSSLADPLWVRTYNGPYNSFDEVHAIGTDNYGNVVVSGFSELSASDWEFVTVKYKPNGDTAWLRHFNPANGHNGATALVIDRQGNIIVTGYVGDQSSAYGDWVTIKYSATGDSLWTATWDHGGNDRATAIEVDSAGNSYVTGQAGSLNYMDFAVVKYDPLGNLVWSFIYDGGNNDGANAVAVDRQGNVYATGYTVVGGNGGDLITVKISPSGDSLWKNIYTGPGDNWDAGTQIAVDGFGNVVVSGFSDDTAGRNDYITIKYNSSGDTVWSRRYNGAGDQPDNLMGLSLDAAGNAYVTGGSYADVHHYDYTTIKYDVDGTERWIAHYPGISHRAWAEAIALDAEANIYVTGNSYDSTGNSDVVTVKYDSAGNQQWAERYAGPYGEDEAYVLALGSDNNSVFVGGRTNSDSGGMDYLTMKYGAAGGLAEDRTSPAAFRLTPVATIIRGSLLLPAISDQRKTISASLLDITGRKVLDLHPGANDIRHIAPGVYFIGFDTETITKKLIITK
jgi:hypothetical protein